MLNKKNVKKMYLNFLEYENNGLTYNLDKFMADTYDKEFNKALIEFKKSKDFLEKRLIDFEEDFKTGVYDKYLKQD